MQIGRTQSDTFYELTMGITEPSSEDSYPVSYEFMGMQMYIDFDKKVITRSTYGILDYLSDIGGLVYILILIGSVILSNVTTYFLDSIIMSKLFEEKREMAEVIENVDDISKIKVDFSSY